jgi:TolB-like protein/Tfp pilus assembly protein PilF
MSLVEELQRRKVLKVGGAYLVLAWLAVQVASIIFPTFDAPVSALRVFILILALGFPICVVMAWLIDATPEGLKLDPATKGNKRVFAIAAVIAALAVSWYFVGQPALRESPAAVTAATTASAAPADAKPKGPPPRSIAVLPFVDMSQGKDQEYFSDGITEEILNALTRIEGLQVAGRTSSFHFKGRNESLQSIGSQLGVSHVLEGSVRKSGDRIRITAQLIKVADGFHLWSETYDRKLDDIFAVQDEISASIATALSTRLMDDGADGKDASANIDPETYDLYLRARQVLADRSTENMVKAADLFKQVVQRAPNFDLGWSGLGKSQALRWNYGGKDDSEAAYASLRKARELNPRNAEAVLMTAYIDAFYRWQFAEALRGTREAIGLAPNDAEIANFAGDNFRICGALDEALAWEQRAAELDPLADFNQNDLAFILQERGRYRESLAASEHAIGIDPTYWVSYDARARSWLALGDVARATAEVDQLEKLQPGLYNVDELRARLAIAKGDKAAALAFLDKLHAREPRGETVSYIIAELQAQLGDLDAAAASLGRAVDRRDLVLPSDSEFVHPVQWPAHPGIQAVFARPELAPMMAERKRFESDPLVKLVP